MVIALDEGVSKELKPKIRKKAGTLIRSRNAVNHPNLLLLKKRTIRIRQFIIKKNGKNNPIVDNIELLVIGTYGDNKESNSAILLKKQIRYSGRRINLISVFNIVMINDDF